MTKEEIDFSKHPENELEKCFKRETIFDIFAALRKSILGDPEMLLFLQEPLPLVKQVKKTSIYMFDHFAFRYTIFRRSTYLLKENRHLKQIQIKVSNDGFYYKNLPLDPYDGPKRFKGYQKMSQGMLNDFQIQFEKNLDFLSVSNLKYCGYYCDDKLRMEIVGKKLVEFGNCFLLHGDPQPTKTCLEISITFEPGYPEVDMKEYSDSYAQLRELAKNPPPTPKALSEEW